MAKRTGTSTQGVETSNRYKRRRARQRREEEAAWAARSGPVTSYVDESVRSAPQAESATDADATVDGELQERARQAHG